MTQEEKQLLIKDLCARLPYGVKADFKQGHLTRVKHEVEGWYIDEIKDDKFEFIRLYLRPISSMTEEEGTELSRFDDSREFDLPQFDNYLWIANSEQLDWLNSHHFDYRGLIEKGLALEAPEEMYKTE